MLKTKLCILGLLILIPVLINAQSDFQTDVIPTSDGDLKITFIGHGTLMFQYQDKVIHIDPVGQMADYSKLPKADLILVTHGHGDHFDSETITAIRKNSTDIVVAKVLEGKIDGSITMNNGDSEIIQGFPIEAVPAYNLKHMRDNGQPYHPKGEGNGYIITFGNKRVYVAGDTENTPEMKALRNIDIAFLPMNLPYTMTPEMVADAAKAFQPKNLYPYHYGDTDPQKLVNLLKDEKGIEVRVRDMR